MSTKSIVVNVSPDLCKTFNDFGFKLCFSVAVGGTFNVVAKASVITSKNTITWTEAYSIFSTVQTFKAGDVIMEGKSEIRDVQPGQTYKLEDWNTTSVSADSTLPPGTLGFSNGVQAAPVVCLKIADLGPAPIFIDKPIPGGFHIKLVPSGQVAVWFEREIDTSTMIVFSSISNAHVIDMTNVEKFETTYNEQDQWHDKGTSEAFASPSLQSPYNLDHRISGKSIVVNVPPGICETLNKAGFKLCFSVAVGGTFNVVAKASVITSKNTISWNQAYSLFGTIQTFKPGDVIMEGKSEIRDVHPGQTYRLRHWNSTTVSADSSLPPGTFCFSNGVLATPVICMQIAGLGPAPIFIDEPLPDGTRTIFHPKAQVAVWFQRELETSTMIVFIAANAHVIDMTDVTKFETTYNEKGQWHDKE